MEKLSVFKEIKKRLLNDTEKIEKILKSMGCEFIKYEQNRTLITCQLPPKFGSHNKRSVQVRLNDSLTSYIRSRQDFKPSDIFDLISYIHFDLRDEEIKKNLNKSKEYICNVCGLLLHKHYNETEIFSDLDWLLEIKKNRKKKKEIEPNPVLPESILDQYIPYPYSGWIKEGISYKTQKMYGIGFDLESKRITIPMRNRFGQLVGVKGRILKDEDDDRKYLYLYPCNNSYELFNFHYAQPYILMEKKVYLFEGEKSVMKLFDNGIYNSVSVGSSSISDVQAEMIKHLGLDIKIIICFDSDKIPKEIRDVAQVFGNREVYGIFDTKGLLGEKESPIDRGIDIFRRLEKECCYPIPIKKSV